MTNATDIIGYTADADTYCPSCAIRYYSQSDNVIEEDTLDGEGNPVNPIFGDAETDTPIFCTWCHEPIPTRIIHYGPESGIDCLCDECQEQAPSDRCPSCYVPVLTRTCSECSIQVRYADCGHSEQPGAVATDPDGRDRCMTCSTYQRGTTGPLSPCVVDGCGMFSSDLPVHLWAVHGLRAELEPCDPPCGPDPCTRHGGTILCRFDSDWWTPAEEKARVALAIQQGRTANDWYIRAGVTDGADRYSCRKCGEAIHPWYTRCEACGDLHPSQEPEPPRWTCAECGTDDYESEIDAERCCSDFYCYDCDYDRSDLREACYCLPDHLKDDYTLACTMHHEHVVSCLDQASGIAFRNKYGQAMADLAGTRLD